MTLLETEALSSYFTVESYLLDDGTILNKDIINSQPQPPPGYEAVREASLVEGVSRSTLANFPAYDWLYGCSAVAGAIIAGYYDHTGYPNIYTGSTNGGVMPVSDTTCPAWSPFDDCSAAPIEIYYYWVKACNSAGCSDYCASVKGWRSSGFLIYVPMINK